MTNPDGTLLGEGFTDIKENKLFYKDKVSFSQKGLYKVHIKLVDTNSKKVLGFTNREFYIISRTPDGVETKLYSGTWQNQSEFTASLSTSSASTSTGVTGTTGTTQVSQVTTC